MVQKDMEEDLNLHLSDSFCMDANMSEFKQNEKVANKMNPYINEFRMGYLRNNDIKQQNKK